MSPTCEKKDVLDALHDPEVDYVLCAKIWNSQLVARLRISTPLVEVRGRIWNSFCKFHISCVSCRNHALESQDLNFKESLMLYLVQKLTMCQDPNFTESLMLYMIQKLTMCQDLNLTESLMLYLIQKLTMCQDPNFTESLMLHMILKLSLLSSNVHIHLTNYKNK